MKKGVALIWAVVLCAVLMLIATIITMAVIKESQFSVRIDSSVRAYSAASSGIEWGKYCIQDNLEKNVGQPEPAGDCFGPNTFTIASSPNNEEYTVKIVKLPDDSYTITSVGKVGTDVKRVLEYVYKDVELESVGNDALEAPVDLQNGFTLSYDFWIDSTAVNTPNIEFGLQNSANPNQKIGVVYEDSTKSIHLSVAKDATETKTSRSIDLSITDLEDRKNEPYWLNIQLKYINKNSAALTLRRRYSGTTELNNKLDYCSARTSIDLSSESRQFNLPFTNFFFGAGISFGQELTPNAGGGDGDIVRLYETSTPSVNIGYIDNIIISQTNFSN